MQSTPDGSFGRIGRTVSSNAKSQNRQKCFNLLMYVRSVETIAFNRFTLRVPKANRSGKLWKGL